MTTMRNRVLRGVTHFGEEGLTRGKRSFAGFGGQKKEMNKSFREKSLTLNDLPEPSVVCLDRAHFRRVLLEILTEQEGEYDELSENDPKFSFLIMKRKANFSRATVLLKEILTFLQTSGAKLETDRLRSFIFLATYLKNALGSFNPTTASTKESISVAELCYTLKMSCQELTQKTDFSKVKALLASISKADLVLDSTYMLLAPGKVTDLLLSEIKKTSLNDKRIDNFARIVLKDLSEREDGQGAVKVLADLSRSKAFLSLLQKAKKSSVDHKIVNFWSFVDSLANIYLMNLKSPTYRYSLVTLQTEIERVHGFC